MQQMNFYCRSYCLLNMFRGTFMPIIRTSSVSYKWLLPAVFGAVKKEIVRSAVVVFSGLSVVCYVRLLWGMSDVVDCVWVS
jgi:hypothetical protein